MYSEILSEPLLWFFQNCLMRFFQLLPQRILDDLLDFYFVFRDSFGIHQDISSWILPENPFYIPQRVHSVLPSGPCLVASGLCSEIYKIPSKFSSGRSFWDGASSFYWVSFCKAFWDSNSGSDNVDIIRKSDAMTEFRESLDCWAWLNSKSTKKCQKQGWKISRNLMKIKFHDIFQFKPFSVRISVR